MKEKILKLISENPGIKGVELAIKTITSIAEKGLPINNLDFVNELEKLVHAGDIIELEYILPQMDYKIKSMFFPKGTEFRINS
jgi:ribosome biogenesis SPOUT family RNA methylase Rps3